MRRDQDISKTAANHRVVNPTRYKIQQEEKYVDISRNRKRRM